MKKDLIGGAVFFRSDSWISKLIRFAGIFQKGHTIDQWSHVGDIYNHNGKLYFVEALSDGVITRPLLDALEYHTRKKQIYVIKKLKPHIRRAFNEEAYNKAINEAIGNPYNYKGAVFAGLDWPIDFKSSRASHCSYYSTKFKMAGNALNKQHNPREWTPQDCYDCGIYEGTGKC